MNMDTLFILIMYLRKYFIVYAYIVATFCVYLDTNKTILGNGKFLPPNVYLFLTWP